MKRTTITLFGATALCLSACGSKVDNTTTASDTTTDLAAAEAPAVLAPGQAFTNKAAASDTFEIESSKLALQKSSSTKVKKFAQSMIAAHTDSTAKLKSAAGSAIPALTPDPTLTAEQQATLDALKAVSGAAFDTAYIDAQRTAHKATLSALQDYFSSGDVPALKSFAITLVPIVTAHFNMATGLKP